jgi:hypothetical protein
MASDLQKGCDVEGAKLAAYGMSVKDKIAVMADKHFKGVKGNFFASKRKQKFIDLAIRL